MERFKCTVNKWPCLQKLKRVKCFHLFNYGEILWPRSVRRTLVIGLIYGLRANIKQFDTAF